MFDVEFLRGFLAGEYDLIGRKSDSATTYTGRVTIRDVGGTLQVIRIIDGKTERGMIQLDTAAERIGFQFFGRTLAWTDGSIRPYTSGDPI